MHGLKWRRSWLVASVGAAVSLGWLASAHPLAAGYLAMASALALPPAFAICAGMRVNPIEPLWAFLAAYAITYLYKPVITAQGRITYAWFRFEPEAAVWALALSAAALIFVYIGYLSGLHGVLMRGLPRTSGRESRSRIRLVATGLAVVSAAGMLVLVHLTGLGMAGLFQAEYRATLLSGLYGRGYFTLLFTVAAFAPAMQLWVVLDSQRAGDRVALVAIVLMVMFVLAAMYSRQLMLQSVVTLLVVAHLKGRYFRPQALIAAGIVILLAGGALGLRQRGGSLDPLEAFAFLGHTFDSFEFLAPVVVRFPMTGVLSGESFVEDVFWTYVPRVLVPDKPSVFGIVRIQDLVAPALGNGDVRAATYPPGYIVEWFINFGLPGVVVISLVYGVWLRTAREWVWGGQAGLFGLLVYGGIVLNLTAVFRSSAQYFTQAIVLGLTLYALLCFGATGSRGHRAARQEPNG